ncbi:MAG: DUF4383 domain-containing protein [Pseudonocardia sp.]
MTTRNPTGSDTGTARMPVQLAATVVGAVFLLVGILGFVPGVTTDYDQLALAGHGSGALLLGVFAVSILHNIVHAAFGVVGLVLARTATGARNFLIFGGAVYALLWIYGVAVHHDSAANFVPVNNADNWLHLALAVGMIALGVVLGRTSATRAG